MRLGSIVPASYFLSLTFVIVGACLKIMHAEHAEAWLTAAFVASIVFVATAIYEVVKSARLHRTEKIMWVVALICFSSLAGLIYILMGRRKVA